jgi:hypothetical protein
MANTISRDELKQKLDRKDAFLLVETLPATAYHHNHYLEQINLPPDRVKTLLLSSYPIKARRSSFTAPVLLETLQRTPPVTYAKYEEVYGTSSEAASFFGRKVGKANAVYFVRFRPPLSMIKSLNRSAVRVFVNLLSAFQIVHNRLAGQF